MPIIFSIYGIDISGYTNLVQNYYSEVNAVDIDKAKYFAFHSQYPFMYYATDSKVYAYNLQTKQAVEVASYAGEQITMIKFNLYSNAVLRNLNDQSPEFMAQQFQLIVATYNSKDATNGGKLGFYEVNNSTMSLTLKGNLYSGFAKIVDVVYRERRS